MKYKIRTIKLHSFKNFDELTYNVSSGKIFGRGNEGKTNLLSSIAALAMKAEPDGKSIAPLSDGTSAGWVSIEWDVDGSSSIKSYREWRRTDGGFLSSGEVPVFDRQEFFLIHNPLYIFQLSQADRNDILVDLVYKNKDALLVDEISNDVYPWVREYAERFGMADVARLRRELHMQQEKLVLAAKASEKIKHQLEVVSDPDMILNMEEARAQNEREVRECQESIDTILIILDGLLSKAVEILNSKMILTRFDAIGNLSYNDMPLQRLSGSELLECGLDIANMVAGITKLNVPPTIIDNAAIYGKSDVDMDLYENLSQIITASYADVDLCEYDNNCLVALDRSWKTKTSNEFRIDVQIEMLATNIETK